MNKKILLTGEPGVGKTFLFKKILEAFDKKIGFVTNEIQINGLRIGFKPAIFDIETKCLPLSIRAEKTPRLETNLKEFQYIEYSEMFDSVHKSIEFNSYDKTFGKYKINATSFEDFLSAIKEPDLTDLLYLDEIGPMQLQSDKFETFVTKYLDAENRFIGTIKLDSDHPFICQIKERSDITIITVTKENRDELEDEIVKMIM